MILYIVRLIRVPQVPPVRGDASLERRPPTARSEKDLVGVVRAVLVVVTVGVGHVIVDGVATARRRVGTVPAIPGQSGIIVASLLVRPPRPDDVIVDGVKALAALARAASRAVKPDVSVDLLVVPTRSLDLGIQARHQLTCDGLGNAGPIA